METGHVECIKIITASEQFIRYFVRYYLTSCNK